MKILISILLVFSVVIGELANAIHISDVEVCMIDLSLEFESEKESSEKVEDLSKEKFKQELIPSSANEKGEGYELQQLNAITTPYLEKYSPPPEL